MAAVVLGTRASALARAQTERVIELLAEAWPGIACEARPIVTQGDRTQSSGEPLPAIGGKGLFTAELEQALRSGDIHLAVHSLKDLPTEEPVDITLGAICLREDMRDCLVAREGLTLAELPAGAVVGTSSLRRTAQLRALRPDLEVRSIRGNVDTRVRKVREGEFDAAVLAAAGIKRLGLEDVVTEWLDGETMLPAPGQGALAVQCQAGDEPVLALLAAIDDPATRAATTAERTFLRELGAGCTAPVAASAHAMSSEPSDNLSQGFLRLRMTAIVASSDGQDIVRVEGDGEPEELGERLAREALAAGADRILDVIRGIDLVAQSHKVGTFSGRRVVVTRPREQARVLAERLERLGASVSVVPLVAVEPVEDTGALDAALESIDDYDWIVFTSANGVAIVRDRLTKRTLGGITVAAVGPATADAVRGLGTEPSFVPERFAAGEIARGLEPLEGKRVLLPQADIAEPQLADELRSRGATVDVIVAYRTLGIEPSMSGIDTIGRADAVVLASGSAARSFASLEGIGDPLLVCIGHKTADAARQAGLKVGLVADEATADGIIQALVAHFGQQSGKLSE